MTVAALMLVLALAGAQQAQSATTAEAAPEATPAATAAATPTARPDPLDRRVCRDETVVGSRFGSRVCMTQREWNQRRDESRAQAQRIGTQQDNAGGRIVAPGH